MNNRGSVLLIAALVAVVLLMAGAFLLVVPATRVSAPGAPGGSGINATVALTRTPTGMTATVTVTNNGSKDLKNLRISKASLSAGSPPPPLPINLGRLSRGTSTTVAIPFTGSAPSPNTPVSVDITCDYELGWFGKGALSTGTTLVRP